MTSFVIGQLAADVQRELRQSLTEPVCIGYSGGVDSTLLLTLACRALGPDQVTAVHINHGLSADADAWAAFCERNCRALGCDYVGQQVSVVKQGQGLEAEARRLRYETFGRVVPESGCLLLGHHRDDQVETFFLRLFRGAGVHGLQGMARWLERDHYRIYRPLLDLTRQDIEQLARSLDLEWLDDDSNTDTRFDRNFLRHEVLPLIEGRWPAYRDRVIQTQQLLSAGADTADTVSIEQELEHRLSHDQGLKMVQLDQLSRAQTLSLIHRWLTGLGQPVPSSDRLAVILDEVVHARADAQPCAQVGQGKVLRHGPALYWVRDSAAPESPPTVSFDNTVEWPGVGQLILRTVHQGPRLRADLPGLNWRLRSGGEAMRPIGRSRSRDLKRLMQEYRIKPWLRDRMPLLFSADELVAVGDELLSADHLAEDDGPGFVPSWQKSD